MTEAEWIEYAKANQQKLEYLIGRYHPVRLETILPDGEMRITAPNAENACIGVRDHIRRNFEGDPITQFANALKNSDIARANTILNEAWFGVPESTSCWRIEGFREAVRLMEDLPE